jgi:hypothetical protein
MPRKSGLTTISILSFGDELMDLCHSLDNPTTEEEVVKVEARIKELCERLYPDSDSTLFGPGGKLVTANERFLALFAKRYRSSQDFIDYVTERDRILARAAEQSAHKHRENLQNLSSQRWNHDSRNMQMAREFRTRKKSSHLKDSRLKEMIGRKYHLKRSASIEAIDRGLEL